MGSSSFIPGMAMCFVLKFVQMHDPWMQSLAAHEVQDAQSWHLSQWLVLLSFSHRHCIYDTKSEEAIHTPATRLEDCKIFLFFPFPFCFWSASWQPLAVFFILAVLFFLCLFERKVSQWRQSTGTTWDCKSMARLTVIACISLVSI